MSWAKSVLPPFTGASSETFRKVPDPVQIDTTLNRQNCIQNHAVKGRRPFLNRTAVLKDIFQGRRLFLQSVRQAISRESGAHHVLVPQPWWSCPRPALPHQG